MRSRGSAASVKGQAAELFPADVRRYRGFLPAEAVTRGANPTEATFADSTDWSNAFRNTGLPGPGRKAGSMCLFTRHASTHAMPARLITGTIGKQSGKNIPPNDILLSKNVAAPSTGTLPRLVTHGNARQFCAAFLNFGPAIIFVV